MRIVGWVAWICLGLPLYVQDVRAAEGASATVLEREAEAAFAERRYAQALELLDRLEESRPLSIQARILKTKTLIELGRPKDALDVYDQVAKERGRDEEALLEAVAMGFIRVLFKDMREQMRGAAYSALKELESEAVVPDLEDGLSDGSGLVRALAAEALGQLKNGRKSTRLRKAMEDQASMVRANVVRAVGLNGDKRERPFLEQALNDEQPMVRVQAIGALLRFGRKESWAALVQAAQAANPEARSTALRVMGELKDPRGQEYAIAGSRDPQPSVRGGAAAALGMLGKAEGLEPLVKLMGDKIPAVRSSAAVALGELGKKEAVPFLRKAFQDPDPGVKGAAVDSMLRLGEPFPDIEEAVRGLMRAQDPGPRSAVAKALARGTGPNRHAALTYLDQMLRDPLPRPRIAAARSLGRIGDRRHIPDLKEALRDQDAAVQATAAASLIRLLRQEQQAVQAHS
jgi:HEAT repeat protein